MKSDAVEATCIKDVDGLFATQVERLAAELGAVLAAHYEPPAFKALAQAIAQQVHLAAICRFRNSAEYARMLDFRKSSAEAEGDPAA